MVKIQRAIRIRSKSEFNKYERIEVEDFPRARTPSWPGRVTTEKCRSAVSIALGLVAGALAVRAYFSVSGSDGGWVQCIFLT